MYVMMCMNFGKQTMAQLKDRMNFTIDRDVRAQLEAVVPRARRSAFVEGAIERALAAQAREALVAFLDTVPKSSPKEGADTVATLRAVRRQMYSDATDFGTLDGA